MNDEMKEYDLPEMNNDGALVENESSPVDEAPVVEDPVVDSVVEPIDDPLIEPIADLPKVVEVVTESFEQEPEIVTSQEPPSKFRQIIHKVSVWLLGILGFALVLYLVFYFAMFRPMKQAHDTLVTTNEEMEEQLSDYRVELETLSDDYEAVSTESDDFFDDTVLYQGYVHFLDLKNDMLLLQKAYLEEDLDSATLALTKATRDLEAFIPTLTQENEPMVDVLRSKIALLSTLEGDAAANIEEVETIYDFLLEMEDDIFGTLE